MEEKENSWLVVKTLTWPQKTLLKTLLWLSQKVTRYREKLTQSLEKLKKGLEQESEQTKDMLEIYSRQVRGQASREEVAAANHQFRDILRGMGLGVLLVLPFAPLTLPLLVKLGEKLGVEILPDSFRNDDKL